MCLHHFDVVVRQGFHPRQGRVVRQLQCDHRRPGGIGINQSESGPPSERPGAFGVGLLLILRFVGNAQSIPDTGKPNIYEAFREQLGLRLESTRTPADIIVIDKVEKPSEN